MDGRCAYCGTTGAGLTRDHVVSACLYPGSKVSSKVQRITVPACSSCNRSWTDDEAHFRSVALAASDANLTAEELWPKVVRSFQQVDGERRRRDVRRLMEPVQVEGTDRWMIYPGRDQRVIRVIRKIVRGLSYYHGLGVISSDARVWADVLKFRIPAEFLEEVTFLHREPDVFQYWFEAYPDGEFASLWYCVSSRSSRSLQRWLRINKDFKSRPNPPLEPIMRLLGNDSTSFNGSAATR